MPPLGERPSTGHGLMLDVALIDLIAAGLVRFCAPATVGNRAYPAGFDSEELIRRLTAADSARVGQLTARVVEDIWQSCRAVGLPAELAQPHVAFLAAVIAGARLRDADQARMCDPEIPMPQEALGDLCRRILASNTLDLAEHGIDETVLGYLLDAYLASLSASRSVLQAMPELMAQVLPNDDQDATAQKAVALAKIQRAEALGIAVPILDLITVKLINTTRSADLRQADLLAAAEDARSLGEALEQLPESEPALADYLSALPDMFRTGRIADCERVLASTEDLVVRHSVDNAPHSGEHVGRAIKLRTQRAYLAALDGSFTKAARHFGFAQRYVPRADVETRWRFARLEAHYYELAASYRRDETGLDNAARACTSAIAAMTAEHASAARAMAQTQLGHVLILLGEKERVPDRFELAAQLLEGAGHVFAEAGLLDGVARHAAILRAAALHRLGVMHRNGDLLESAISLYQSIIEQPAMDDARSDPAEISLGLRSRMALALIDYAELEPADQLRAAAIASIEAVLPQLRAHGTPYNCSAFNRRLLVARCHEALARWYRSKGDQAGATAHFADAGREYTAVGFGRPDDLPPKLPADAPRPSPAGPGDGAGEADAA